LDQGRVANRGGGQDVQRSYCSTAARRPIRWAGHWYNWGMSEAKDDLDRLARLKGLARLGALTDAEEGCLRKIYAAHGPWAIAPSTGLLDLLGKRPNATQLQVLTLLERREVDAILAAHELHQ
jgi:hypothetical protein